MQSPEQHGIDFNQLEKAFPLSYCTAFYVIIRNRSLYRELVALNRPAEYRHKWFYAPEPTDAASESTALTAEENSGEFGAIRFEQPTSLHEKRREGYTGSFLFGRYVRKNRFVDFAFAQEKTVNKVSFGLFYSWEFDSNWMIQCEGSNITVNDVPMNKFSSPFGFNPRAANIVKMVIPTVQSGLRIERTVLLEFHCNPHFAWTEDISMHFSSNLRLDTTDRSQQFSSTSMTTVQDCLSQLENTEILYLLKDTTWKSRRDANITYTLAMDPWTCVLYIAKPFSENDRRDIEERLRVFEKLHQHDAFILHERIVEQAGQLFLLARHRDAKPLEKYQNMKAADILQLLLVLIKNVSILHGAGIVHNDINLYTILLEDDNPERPLIAGFSQWASFSKEGAVRDCFQIFEMIKICLEQSKRKLKTGNLLLDNLLAQLPSGIEAWTNTVQDVLFKLDTDGFWKTTSWTAIKASKKMQIRYHYRDGDAWIHVGDLKDYISKLAIARMTTYDDWHHIDEIGQFVTGALSKVTDETGHFKATYFHSLCNHLKERFDIEVDSELIPRYNSDLTSYSSVCPVKVNFRIPYNTRYGIMNLEYLWNIDCKALRSEVLQELVDQSLEVRGDPRGQGVFISIESISIISTAFEMRFEELPPLTRDSSMDKYTHHEWYLYAPHAYPELFACNRRSGKVRLESGEDIPMTRFLEQHFLYNKYIDCDVLHSPISLLHPKAIQLEPGPSESSIRLTDDSDLNLRFPSRRNKGYNSTTLDERHVSEWVRDAGNERRNKRTFSTANARNMVTGNEEPTLDIPAARVVEGKSSRKR